MPPSLSEGRRKIFFFPLGRKSVGALPGGSSQARRRWVRERAPGVPLERGGSNRGNVSCLRNSREGTRGRETKNKGDGRGGGGRGKFDYHFPPPPPPPRRDP